VLFRTDTKFTIESVVPHLLHIVPVDNDTVLNWLFDFQNAALSLGLLTNIDLSLVEANHDAWDLWTAHNSAED